MSVCSTQKPFVAYESRFGVQWVSCLLWHKEFLLIHCQLVLEVGMVALNRHINNSKLPTEASMNYLFLGGDGGRGGAEVCVKYPHVGLDVSRIIAYDFCGLKDVNSLL